MIYEAGFYKLDNELLYGPNFVKNANYELYKDTHDQHVYPIDGWHWFDSLEDACQYFGLNIEDYITKAEQ